MKTKTIEIDGKIAPTYFMKNVKSTDELLILTVIAGDVNKFNTQEICEQMKGKSFEEAKPIFEQSVGKYIYLIDDLKQKSKDESVIYDASKMCKTFIDRLNLK